MRIDLMLDIRFQYFRNITRPYIVSTPPYQA
jgi:hypothetical protein